MKQSLDVGGANSCSLQTEIGRTRALAIWLGSQQIKGLPRHSTLTVLDVQWSHC